MPILDIFKKKRKVAEASPHLPPRSASQSSVKEVKPVEKPKEEIPSEKPSTVTRALAKGEDERSSSTRVKKSADSNPPTTLPRSAGPSVRPPQVKRVVRAGEAWRILKAPHITEKATDLTKKNQYVFKIFPRVNKTEIKKAIEGLYGIDVVSVKIIKVPRKQRKVGKHLGWRKGYKKAIVRIKEGQKIEVLPR